MINWLKFGKINVKKPPTVLLPDPNEAGSNEEALGTAAANECVQEVLEKSTPKKRKREDYGQYSPELRAKMARYCIDNGPAKTSRHFSQKLGKPVNESTIRSIKTSYLKSQTPEKPRMESLLRSPRGRPLKIGTYDSKVQSYVKQLRVQGAPVNTSVVIGAAHGIISHYDRLLLHENGGHIELTTEWAKSLMNRMGLCKRKATKGVKTLPSDFDDIKAEYLKRYSTTVSQDGIPDDLIINWDQTGVNFVPCGNWTMEQKGAKQVPLKGLDDKRQMTAVLAITKSGKLLPPQLIYQGKTDACHPKYKFPDGYDVFHSESHWSTSETMARYIEKVIVPYIAHIRDENDYPLGQKALCIFDVFAAHRTEAFLDLLERKRIRVVFVPAACTDKLQPLDLLPNNAFKQHLRKEFQMFYAKAVEKSLTTSTDIANIDIDLRLSSVKENHAQWLVNAFNNLSKQTDLIKKSFEMAGLSD